MFQQKCVAAFGNFPYVVAGTLSENIAGIGESLLIKPDQPVGMFTTGALAGYFTGFRVGKFGQRGNRDGGHDYREGEAADEHEFPQPQQYVANGEGDKDPAT